LADRLFKPVPELSVAKGKPLRPPKLWTDSHMRTMPLKALARPVIDELIDFSSGLWWSFSLYFQR
jgi:hypothetical protein